MKSRPLDIFKRIQILYSPLLIKPAHLLLSQLVGHIPSRSIRQMLVIFSGGEFLNTVLYRNLGKQKGSRFLVFTSSKKSEISNFRVVVVQRRQRNMYKKRDEPAKLLYY